jgi:cobalamin biosynthesis Mg chelatase CobN
MNNLQLMKNTITLLVAVLLIACGLPSCGTTLIKRQHSSGYYVNKNPRIPTAESERSDNKHIKPRSTKAENADNETDPPSDEQATFVHTSSESEIQLATNDPSNGTSEEVTLKTDQSASVVNDQVQSTKPSLYEWASNTRLSPKMNFASADQQSNSARDSEGGLSLFGLVILILVILWLVAVLSGGWGLGGLIHVLLIIALILLILWLLRII